MYLHGYLQSKNISKFATNIWKASKRPAEFAPFWKMHNVPLSGSHETSLLFVDERRRFVHVKIIIHLYMQFISKAFPYLY